MLETMNINVSRIKICALLLLWIIPCIINGAFAYTIYVSNEKDNSISVIDGETLKLTQTIKVGERPRGIVLSHDDKYLYICASDDDHIEVLDLATQQVVYTLPSGPDPELMSLTADGSRLFVANEDDNMVTVIDTVQRRKIYEIPVGIEPEGIGLSPDGKWLVSTSETTNMAHFINTETLKIEDNVLVDARPRVAQYTPDGSEVWVSSEIGGTVAVIDANTRQIKHKIEFEIAGLRVESIQPVGIKIAADGSHKVYIALGPSARLAVVNAKTYQVEKYLLVGPRVWNLEFSPDHSKIFTTNGIGGDVSVIDLTRQRVIKSIKVGRLPWGIAISR